MPVVAERSGGSVQEHERGVELLAGGGRVLLTASPRDDAERRERYLHALIPAARALLSVETCSFRCRIPGSGRAGDGDPVRVLRAAFGVYDQAGPLRLRRLTAYHLDPWDLLHVAEGDDRLFDDDAGREAWSEDEPAAEISWKRCLAAVLAATEGRHGALLATEESRRQLRSRSKRRFREIDELESFYRGGRKRVALRGVTDLPDGMPNDAAGEHRRRLLDALRRHQTGFAVHVLSVGEIACRGRREQRDGGWQVTLPFAEFPSGGIASG